MAMKVLLSLPCFPTIQVRSGRHHGHEVTVSRRDSDWGKSGARKYLHHMRQAVKFMRAASNFEAAVLATVGIEAFFVAGWRQALCPNTVLMATDLLMPRPSRALHIVGPWLKRLDGFACIRRGDIDTLESRFGVPRERCFFVPFPASEEVEEAAHSEDYIYSAGDAHRDWPTLAEALISLPHPVRIATRFDLSGLSGLGTHAPHIALLGAQSPEAGRALASRAALVVLPMEDTLLPSGPLVLLDAMAMGKAVVATDVNGTRDYVLDGLTAVLVPPRDARALALAIDGLMRDEGRRRQMGAHARADVRQRFTTDHFLAPILGKCAELRPRP